LYCHPDTPEVTGTASILPSSIKVSQSTLTPTATGSSSTSTSHSSSNAGAIAGGVVGGLLGAALIAAVVAWFVIRRRRARSAPSTEYMSGQGGEMGQPVPYPLTVDAPRLYVSILFLFFFACSPGEREVPEPIANR
jgi:hypothetical protein